MTPVLGRTLWQERRTILGWVVGIAVLVLITCGSWPAVRSSAADFEEILRNMPPALTAFFGEGFADFSAAGIVGTRLFGTVGLGIFIGYAVSRGARAIAGEEQDGTLELIVTQPWPRRTIAVDKVVALMLSLAALVTGQFLLLLLLMPAVGLDFVLGNVMAASAGLYVLSALFGALAFAVGAATGRRARAVGVGAGTAAGLFVAGGIAGLIDGLEVLADISPFTHFDGAAVLTRGLSWMPVALNAVMAVVLIAVGVTLFDRRDIS